MTENSQRYAGELFPSSYASWRYCIETKCGLPLTAEFIQARIDILSNAKNQESRRFSERYGNQYLEQVLAWFQRAATET